MAQSEQWVIASLSRSNREYGCAESRQLANPEPSEPGTARQKSAARFVGAGLVVEFR